jgi:transcriptional regulator with XRE-family HTH domain
MALSKISELRQRKGLTQKELADQLGMTVTGFQNWERGTNNRKHIERVAKLCEVFECSPKDLLEVLS